MFSDTATNISLGITSDPGQVLSQRRALSLPESHQGALRLSAASPPRVDWSYLAIGCRHTSIPLYRLSLIPKQGDTRKPHTETRRHSK